ncbi:MAG: class I SAM-dependent methyltransferase [Candidatus Magasanikbacteria bacterium]|nr:class I SAM-dependent methyltransferase [Candidatus Magasanikbacteria bacterium]
MIIETSGGSKLLDPKLILQKLGLKDKMVVADLGCGAVGHFVFPASRMVGKDGKVYAVDIQRSVLENIEKRADLENLENIVGVWSDLERLGATKVESESVDAAILINTLFQNKDRETILKEARRLLKVGGKLLVVDWLLTSSPFGPPVEGRVDPFWVEQIGDQLGLRLMEKFSAGKYHYGLIFEK